MDNTTGSTPNAQSGAGSAPPKPALSATPPQQAQGAQGAAKPQAQPAQSGAAPGGAAKQPDKSATQMASEAKHDIQSQAKSAVAAGKNRAVDAIGGVAQSLQSSAKQMRDQQQNGMAHYVESAGQQVQRAADYLKNNDAGQIADQAEDFARRKPAIFLGAAFAVGMLGARFLRSSRRQEQDVQRRERARQGLGSWSDSQYGDSAPSYDRERAIPGAGSMGSRDTWGADQTGRAGTQSGFAGRDDLLSDTRNPSGSERR